MTDYKIWRPEYDGHAPPNWRKGMKWTLHEWQTLYGGVDPRWLVKNELYYVEPKALNSPNDDAMPGAIQDALYVLRQYPADELAKHGITLAPEKDWATELWAETFDIFDRPDEAELIRRGTIDERDKEVISLFRTRFEQMIAERNKRDAQD